MTEAGVVEASAIVVEGHGAVGDLVAAVAIHVAYAQVVVALSCIAAPLGGVGVEGPADCQLFAVEVVGGDARAGVVAATEDGAQVLAVEVAAGGQETVAAVGVVVAPAAQLTALGDIVDGADGTSALALKAGDPFRALVDEAAACSLAVHVVRPSRTAELLAGVVVGLVGCRVRLADMIGVGIAEDGACAVDGAVAGANKELSTAVAIEVCHDEGRIVSTAANVGAEVDAPHGGAVQAQGFENGGRCDAAVAVVFGVGGVPLQDNLHLSVAIEVCHGGVVGVVGESSSGRSAGHTGRRIKGDVEIADGSVGGKVPLTV